ncbi:MAG: hypothetical protein JWN21_1151 [Sphingomonas bacterium]|uniref:hypothetical protein n=1 Tax=Sphingomonas bacterium TaxID=1895847 RepID=UPI0026238A85|nr:hypothetical protein [Sphingomonas bacterium]MDB5695608.1 hypothetical protein [Sphingomonas bacterium]
MKSVSKLALAALLATGMTGAALTAPAFAQKKKDAAKGPMLSAKVAPAANAAQVALSVTPANPAAAEPLVAAFEAVATSDFERYIASRFRYSVEDQKIKAAQAANPRAAQDQSGLARALDALIANPATPAEDRPKFMVARGEMAYASKQYASALDLFTRAQAAGYSSDNLMLSIVKAKVDSGDVSGGVAELERVIAAATARGEKPPVDYYRFAISQSNKKKLGPQTVAWMNRYLAAYPSGKTWYEVLATYGFQQGSTATLTNPQKIDLFRLMRASGGLPDQYFYIEYAQKAQDAGLPLETQAVLKEGLANGKIPAGNTEARALMAEAAGKIRLESSLASLEAKANASANGLLAGQTADANLSTGNYAKAASLYRTALQKGGVDVDTINTRLGIALARSGDKAGAQAAFAAVKAGPRGEIAAFWTTWLNSTPAA